MRGARVRNRFVRSTLALVASAVFAGVAPALPSAAQEQPPSIVLLLTDDQRWDTLWAMPTVSANIVDRGVEFTQAFVVNPLCCPSRASILTGKYSHSTGVYTNGGTYGGFGAFDDSSTLATWLHDEGYQTALIGKYLNGYEPPYVPPGWDEFAVPTENKYFDYSLFADGVSTPYGSAESDYSTDVLADRAVTFIEDADPGRPLLLQFSPTAPHAPATPAPRHAGAFPGLEPWRLPSYNEGAIGDKPEYIRTLPKLKGDSQVAADGFRVDQFRTLLAVDEAVGRIVDALDSTGRLGNTVIVFASDNGILWGEHRWRVKVVPYEESIRVPLVVRYDPLTTSPRRDDHLVLNVDLAPTFAEIAGVASPGAEGASIVPLLSGNDPPWRSEFVVEHYRGGTGRIGRVPTYCAIRDRRFLYAYYGTGEEELYDLQRDEYQLRNRATDDHVADRVIDLRVRLAALCDPPPPDLTLP